MCGIVGVVGRRQTLSAIETLLSGLDRLKYRGYDSAGIAISDAEPSYLVVVKKEGKLENLRAEIGRMPPPISSVGIAHTRWATHGNPSDRNAHPHSSCHGEVAIVHNGILENYRLLRRRLQTTGHEFSSDTDSEVFAHLIEDHLRRQDFPTAVRMACKEAEGTFGLAVLSVAHPGLIIIARRGSPLTIGVGKNAHFVASDSDAFLGSADQKVDLKDDEMAILSPDDCHVMTIDGEYVNHRVETLDGNLDGLEKGEQYSHFMLKEIEEQPTRLHDAFRGRLDLEGATSKLGGLESCGAIDRILRCREVRIIGSGTSLHAAMIIADMLEAIARIPARAENASELRYRNAVLSEDVIGIVLSQSGESADPYEAMREMRRRNCSVYGLVNKVGSLIARENDGGVYIHAGREQAVASTKAYTNILMVGALLALELGRRRDLGSGRGLRIIEAIQAIPDKVSTILGKRDQIQAWAEQISKRRNALFLGRGYNYPTALEGALKLKEVSYIHAEGYPAAEMKHGPIALIDAEMPVIVVATAEDRELFPKIKNNIAETHGRHADLYIVTTEGCIDEFSEWATADRILEIPNAGENFLSPILAIIPFQLLAYHSALLLGRDVDHPRNLAKSVTVE